MTLRAISLSTLLLSGVVFSSAAAQVPVSPPAAAASQAPTDAKAALVADIVKTSTEVFRTATDSKKEPSVIQAGIVTTVSYVVRAALARGVDRESAGQAIRTVRTDPSLHLDPLIIKSMGVLQANYPVMPTPPAASTAPTP